MNDLETKLYKALSDLYDMFPPPKDLKSKTAYFLGQAKAAMVEYENAEGAAVIEAAEEEPLDEQIPGSGWWCDCGWPNHDDEAECTRPGCNKHAPNYKKKRAEEWADFLARMNSPVMVERRGTILTCYGWRETGC